MKVFIDTNILISAFLNSNSISAKAYMKAVENYETWVCQKNIGELEYVVRNKFPQYVSKLDSYKENLLKAVNLIETPTKEIRGEDKIRDINDRPIFRAAISVDVDIILTGDKDFLEAGIKWPMIMSPAEFLEYEDTPPTDPLLVAERRHKYSRKIK